MRSHFHILKIIHLSEVYSLEYITCVLHIVSLMLATIHPLIAVCRCAIEEEPIIDGIHLAVWSQCSLNCGRLLSHDVLS